MNHVCKKKLRSESGVSLSVALLFFVVCAALASMILAAAYAASGRVTSRMTLNQDHYAVDSAASLISDELKNDVIVIQEKADAKQNEDGSYTVIDDSGIDTSYYEVNHSVSSIEDAMALVDASDPSVRNVTKNNQSLLVKEYTGMYSAYLGHYTDDTAKFFQARLASAPLDGLLKSSESSFGVTAGSDDRLQCNAAMTLAPDLSLDIVVTSNSSSVHVYCAPDVTTTYTYAVRDEGDVNGVQTVTKTTMISFTEAKVTRS
ncbi:hypothetical protein [Lactimicrobium massiliense]|uniref:hypothetical protein n=1 Tax=Lactimicrobium massiliense TaxID=2161814 RepID=UPI000D560EBB|nr:hypothetical protein [Lactimicrobium massiliense]